MLTAGAAAPNFTATDILGSGTFTLAAHSGEVVCLAMVAYWCPHCSNEMPRLQHLWMKYQGHGVQIVAVHVDSNQSAALTWLNNMGITFPVIQDNATMAIFNAYATGYTGIPQLYIINRGQVIHYSGAGEESESVIEGHILDAIYSRDSIDLEMVMDVSDTMNDTPPGAADPKLTLMRQAAKMIIDFVHDHGQTGDRAGLVWFSDNASQYTNAASQHLVPVVANTTDLKNQIDAHGTGICTAMGAGLQMAFDALSSSTQKHFAVLLTDGMQNIEPKVEKVDSQYEIIDSDGWLCGGHSSTSAHPGVDIANYNTRVHTIGVGIAATYASLLQDLADSTQGIYLGTNDPGSDLNLIYFVDLCNCMAGSSPAVVYHHSGQFLPQEEPTVERFALNRSVRKFTAILSWDKSLSGSLTFWLRAPDGTLLDLHEEIKLYDAYAMATVYLPKEQGGNCLPYVGDWQMIVHGETGGCVAAYQALVVAEDVRTRFTVEYPRRTYEVGEILPLRLSLEEGSQYITKVTDLRLETATLRVPVAEMLSQYRPRSEPLGEETKRGRLDPLHRKLEALARDPRISNQLEPTIRTLSLRAGNLRCEIERNQILVPVTLNQPGLHTFRICVLAETAESGPLCRLSMASLHVGAGAADPRHTTVSLIPVTTEHTRSLLFDVTPRNAFGQMLGPGLADAFVVRLGRERAKSKVEDPVDGTYRISVVPEHGIPAEGLSASLVFHGKTFWEGSIEG